MEEYLRFGLLFIAGIILMLILLESFMRRRRLKFAEMAILKNYMNSQNDSVDRFEKDLNSDEKPQIKPQRPVPVAPPNYLMISIFAKVNSRFASYDLLQAITAAGLQFGEMNIFHYYHRVNGGHEILFSLASATKPGHFDLDNMGDFSCLGLTLFMDIDQTSKPSFAFEKMLATAEQLADDLDGELRASPQRPWTQEILNEYRKRIASRHSIPVTS